jgi:hypothetical protein
MGRALSIGAGFRAVYSHPVSAGGARHNKIAMASTLGVHATIAPRANA